MRKFALAALLLFAGAAAAQEAEKVKVPLEALGEILKRHPNGRMLSDSDWHDLLKQAGVKSLRDLAPAEDNKPPVSWSIESCDLTGSLQGEQMLFDGDAVVRVLEAKQVLVPVPLAAIGARAVKVDGADAKLVRSDADGGFAVLLDGPGEKHLSWSFSQPIEKLEEKGSGAFLVPLLRQAVAAKLTLALPGDLEVSSAQCALSVEHADGKTTANAACGGREAVRVEFRPRTAEVESLSFVTVDDATCFVVRRGLVQLELAAHFSIHRTGGDHFAIDLPAGFAVRSLDAATRDRGERPAPWGGSWIQRGDRVELSLPKPRQGELAVVLRAELVAPQEGDVALRLPAYPGVARSAGLCGVARADDMTVVVSDAKQLERADLDALVVSGVSGILRVYRHGSQSGSVAVSVKPIEPKVQLVVRAAEHLLDREMRMGASWEFHVTEGKVYQFRCELPDSWRVDATNVTTERGAVKHDLRTETKDGKTLLLVDLEGGVRAGSVLTVDLNASRDVPSGIAAEKSLPCPRLAGAPATATTGFLGFGIDPAFRLRSDVKGLLPVPLEALSFARMSAEGLSLAFKLDRPDYSGTLSLVKNETRIAARSLVYYQIDERTIATDAKLDFDISGAPVESLEVVLPAGAGKLARIDGDDIADKSLRAESKDGERWVVHFQQPKSGLVTLLVHFDTTVAGFEKAEGAGQTKTVLPAVHAGEGCERERGQLAVFSSDSTEITAEPEHLHAIEVTEVEAHPAVKPAGRPLCAFTYAGLDGKLGIEIVRHEGAAVLSAIVEQLSIESSFGKDGLSRHTAKFRCKNLSHQFFNLKVPEGAQIWSVLVDGEGVKPAAEGDQKIIPLTKAGSPDRAVEVAVTYEVHGGSMGHFGSGALAAPVLLERSGGEPIPVLRTQWSLALPDDFRYFEFSGNAEGGSAAVEPPLVVQWWLTSPDSVVLWTGITIFVLALLAGEKSREKLVKLGLSLAGALAAAPKAVRSVQVAMPRKGFIAGLVGIVVLGFVVVSMLAGAQGRYAHVDAKVKVARSVSSQIKGDEGGWGYDRRGARGEPGAPTLAGAAPEPTPAPPPPPPQEEADREADDSLAEKKPMAPAPKSAPAPAKKRKEAALKDNAPRDADDAKKAEYDGALTYNTITGAAKDIPTGKGEAGPATGFIDRTVDQGNAFQVRTRNVNVNAATPELLHRALSSESAFGAKGLSSLVLALPYVGKTWTFTNEGGQAEIGFSYVRSDVWKVAMVLFAILGFASGFAIPRRTKMSYLGFLVLATVLLSTVPYVIAPAMTGGPVNAFLAGLALSAPVVLLLSLDRARLRRVRLKGFKGAAPLLAVGAFLFMAAPTPAHAQDAKKPAAPQDRRVYVPYDPDHPDKKQDRVFVPEELYEELWKKAHPGVALAEKPVAPAAFAVSGANYEGSLSVEKGLSLKVRFRIEILREGWVEAPLGLEGASILEQTIAPEGAKVRAGERGFTLLAQGPKTFDATFTVLLPEVSHGVYSAGALRAGAAVMRLSTGEKDMAIKVLGALGGQTETRRQDGGTEIDASLGAAPQIRIAFGAREVIAHGGGSDASAFCEAIELVRRGRVETSHFFTFTVSGEGREGFLFTVPAGLEVTDVQADALRAWHVKDGVLEVTLRRPCGRSAQVVVKGERATVGTSIELPEIAARAVTREEGRFAVAVEPGLKVRFGKDDGLRQIDPSEVAPRAQGITAERAYAFTKRPAKLSLELLDEPLEIRCSSRAVGVVREGRFEVTAELEYLVKKGHTFELRVLAPSDLELAGDPEGLDVRERVVEKVASGTRYTFGLAKSLAAPSSAVLKLHFQKTLRADDRVVGIADVRALDVAQEDGEVALCVAEGLNLKGERDVEADRFSSADPGPIAASLNAPKDVRAQLGWKRKAKAPSGLSQATAAIEHPQARVKGTAVTFVTVERDVVRTVVRVYYELSDAGCKEFAFRLPARLAKRVSVVAPNQREITFGAASKQEGDEEERVPFSVELQSAVKNFYELTMEWEELVPRTGKIDLARLDLVGCDPVRAFVLVEADPSLTDKLETARARCANVESVRADKAFALPPGKDPRDFAECFRAETPEWKVAFELVPVVQQAPAPCRVETARVTSVIHDDGSVLHKAVWRVRNRSLQFLGVKLPKGAVVWTVHVAGEPKRLHVENGITLIPLPKRADADMGFEVEVVYKTTLDGPLGLLTKVTPQAPLLATKGVTVERTFWSLYLPPRFDAAWTNGNMDETVAAVSEAKNIKARVEELAKLSSLAQSAKSENERQIAQTNVQTNFALVQRDYTVAVDALTHAQQANTTNSAKVAQQLVQTTKELKDLQVALGEVQKRQGEIAQQQGQQRNAKAPDETEVVYGSNKFVRHDGWRVNDGTFKNDRSTQWEGYDVEQQRRIMQEEIDALTAQKNSTEDEKVEAGRKFEIERLARQAQGAEQAEQSQKALALASGEREYKQFVDASKQGAQQQQSIYGADPDKAALRKLRQSVDREIDLPQTQPDLKTPPKPPAPPQTSGQTPPAQLEPSFNRINEKPTDAPRGRMDVGGVLDKIGVGGASGGKGRYVGAGTLGGPAGGNFAFDDAAGEKQQPGRTVNVPDANQVPGWSIKPEIESLGNSRRGYFQNAAEQEAKRSLLSIGFEFQVPAGAQPLHFTTDSNAEDGMQLSLTVVPRTSVDRASRVARALVVLLVVFAVVKLGLLSAADKPIARALGLVVAAGVAGLVFVHVAFAAVAVVASIVALVRARAARG